MSTTRITVSKKVSTALLLGAAALPLLAFGPRWVLQGVAIVIAVGLFAELLTFSVRLARNATSWVLSGILGLLVISNAWGMSMAIGAPHHNGLILSIILVIVATDVSAQFFGRRIGTPGTFMPRWSPNKSLAGAVCSILTGVIIATIIVRTWRNAGEPLSWQLSIALCSAPVLGTYGDVFESVVKRHLGIKDFGRFLGPETGGLLDRFDSWLPVFTLFGVVLLF